MTGDTAANLPALSPALWPSDVLLLVYAHLVSSQQCNRVPVVAANRQHRANVIPALCRALRSLCELAV